MKRVIGLVVACALGCCAPRVSADERIGAEIVVADNGSYVLAAPRAASDGLSTFVVWSTGGAVLMSARIDGAGTVSGPFPLLGAVFPYQRDVDIATDGRNALVVWSEENGGVGTIKAVRLAASGAALDATPITLDTLGLKQSSDVRDTRVAFDGTAYRVVWEWLDAASDTAKVYTRRVGIDGTLFSKRRRIRASGMSVLPFSPRLACQGNTQCLLTWLETGGTNRVVGVRMLGDEMIDAAATDLLRGAQVYGPEIATSGNDYLIVATGTSFGANDAIGARVTGDGVALDINGFRVNNPPAQGSATVGAVGVTFDGTNYVAIFADEQGSCGFKLFAARISPSGQVFNPDTPGLLISGAGSAYSSAIVATRTASVAAWQDNRQNQACSTYPPKSVYAQRALAHTAAPGFPNFEIGAIGAQSVNEQAVLGFTLSASGLNPLSTTFSASNLPAGAVFDAATRTFRWKPAPDEAGTYAGVHFEATDGGQTVSEDVTISVLESSLSLCGTVENGNTPVPGVAVKLKGGLGKPRVVSSDVNGRFCFYFLIQAQYKLKLASPSTRVYRADLVHVVVGTADVTNLHFPVSPR